MALSQITDIHGTKRGRFSIYLDDEFVCVLHAEILAQSGLQIGQYIDPADLEALHQESQFKLAKERALRLLGQRAYTRRRLVDKLQEKADEDTAERVADRMAELGFLDDLDYAARYGADMVNRKGYSLRRAAQELMRRGIDRDVAEDALSGIEADSETAIATVVRRKYLRYLTDEKGIQKTSAALARLGYGYSDIRRVLNNLLEDPAYYDD